MYQADSKVGEVGQPTGALGAWMRCLLGGAVHLPHHPPTHHPPTHPLKVLAWAKRLVAAGTDHAALKPIQRVWIYMPFMHSEELEDQKVGGRTLPHGLCVHCRPWRCCPPGQPAGAKPSLLPAHPPATHEAATPLPHPWPCRSVCASLSRCRARQRQPAAPASRA